MGGAAYAKRLCKFNSFMTDILEIIMAVRRKYIQEKLKLIQGNPCPPGADVSTMASFQITVCTSYNRKVLEMFLEVRKGGGDVKSKDVWGRED